MRRLHHHLYPRSPSHDPFLPPGPRLPIAEQSARFVAFGPGAPALDRRPRPGRPRTKDRTPHLSIRRH